MKKLFSNWKDDLSASVVVYLVALPLCLGIGLASAGSEHVFSGIIAGVVGGIVVGSLSGSHIGVSGPAAGLIAVIAEKSGAIATLGSFEGFLVAVIIAGCIQIVAGYLKAGIMGHYFPSAVIKGMLAAIGILLILNQVPHAVGYDADFMGEESFLHRDKHNLFSELLYAMNALSPVAVIISLVSLVLLILFDRPFMKKIALFKILPGALFVVLLGIGINIFLEMYFPALKPSENHLVQLPVINNLSDVKSFFVFPDFSILTNPKVYGIALVIALIASVETLLSVEATDKLDPEKSRTPRNQELRAQGVGNIISGFLGGLPITQVIVRSSANINAGGKSQLSTILHGIFLCITAVTIPAVLNKIPLASLAAILLMIGYKLSRLELYKQMFKLGYEQYLPFIATIVGVLLTNLLQGIGIGLVIAIFFILRKNYRNNFTQIVAHEDDHDIIKVVLSEEVTFINKGSILIMLNKLPVNADVIIDGSRCKAIDYDVLEIIQDFKLHGSKEKNINLITQDIPEVALTSGH